METGSESEVKVEVEKEGLAAPVTWILCLSVSTCGHLVWTGLLSSHSQLKGFSLVETAWARPTLSQSSACLQFHLFLSYYQWVRLCGKRGGNGRGKVWHLFLTHHMCVCLKIVWFANWGRFYRRGLCDIIDQIHQCAHASERGRVDWDVIHSLFVSIVCVYMQTSYGFYTATLLQKQETREWLALTQSCSLPVLGSPALHKAHADGAHPGELVHSLEALVYWLCEQRSKLLVVEDL